MLQFISKIRKYFQNNDLIFGMKTNFKLASYAVISSYEQLRAGMNINYLRMVMA